MKSSICTLRTVVERNLENNPDRLALIEGDRQTTFQEFAGRTRAMGNALLDLGLEKGDRVGILGHNSMENAESYFSVPNAGLVLVMLNFRLAPAEMLTILRDAAVSVLMVNENYMDPIERIKESLDFVRQFVFIGPVEHTPEGWLHYEKMIASASSEVPAGEMAEDDLAVLMYTSGTTGSPKGCMATHGNFYHIGRSLTLELKMVREDVGIIASPLFHASGEVVLMTGMFSGTTSVILPKWDAAEFLSLVEKHKVTTGMIATPMLLFLMEYEETAKYDHSSLKKVLFSGAPVRPVVFQRAVQQFGNVWVHLFGASELVGQATILRLDDVEDALNEENYEILGSCGKSFVDMQSLVVDENDHPVPPGVVGEIKVRGLGTTMGYWNKEEETKKAFRNGWYYSLDLCRVDEKGFIYVVDRKKDMIITGGENVYPAEVENVLYKHPQIAMAAVIGTPDEKWGEAVTALIVQKGEAPLEEDDVKAFVRKEIAGYKVPKKIVFVDTLPLSASGKVLKYKLRSELDA